MGWCGGFELGPERGRVHRKRPRHMRAVRTVDDDSGRERVSVKPSDAFLDVMIGGGTAPLILWFERIAAHGIASYVIGGSKD